MNGRDGGRVREILTLIWLNARKPYTRRKIGLFLRMFK
jgi:hypothetical protein